MSSKKDLFKSQNPNKFISSANLDKLKEDVESKNFIKAKTKQQKMFTPRVDFSEPANFARYGLAEEYYRTSMEQIYKTYPYDGSIYEKEAWYNNASYLDQYIFDKEYPRTNGYITIGDGDWGTPTAVGNYSLPSKLEYITFNGGPHGGYGSLKNPKSADIDGERDGSLANYYKSSKNRENNLKLDLSTGTTVEFWMKKGAFDSNLTKRETIFDLWNGEASSSAGYGRLRIEMSASAVSSDAVFQYTCQSGTNGPFDLQFVPAFTQADIADGNWHHYAFSFVSASEGSVEAKLYRDGQYWTSNTAGTAFGEIAGTMSASIGALRTSPSGSAYHGSTMNGYGKVLSASFDEFRYWKTERSAKQIFQNYNNQVGGGTNTDDANTDLGVYYKFNEGITTNNTVDAKVLDYSGRVTNGTWVGYTSTSRNTGSAIVLSSASLSEFKDPIIYNFHPDVISVKDRLTASGSYHDNQNNSALFFSVPSWILEEDESYGANNLKYLTQIMSSYLDTLYLQIEELTRVKEVEYTSGSLKPSAFGSRLLSDKGILAPELFIDASIVEQLYARNEKTSFKRDLSEIKNKIYENIYNNLVNIYKSKGTYESFRNILNTLGISQKIVDINLYSNNAEYEILDNRKLILERKKRLNLFKSAYNSATVYQATGSSADTQAFIPETTPVQYTPWTMESRFTLPRDNINSNYYFIENNILSCSLFGFHQTSASNTDFTWHGLDTTAQVYAIRNKSTNKDGYFFLSGAIGGPAGTTFSLSSSVISNLFDDTDWNVAVSSRPTNWPLSTRVSGGTDVNTAIINLRGYNTRGDIFENEFSFAGDVPWGGSSNAQWLASSPKQCYVGAHRFNFTGSVYNNGYSFAKFDNFNFWFNYLSDDDLKTHMQDPKNFGIANAYQPAVLTNSTSSKEHYSASFVPPNIDTLALRWDFETVTGSNASGVFFVDDTTSGSSGFDKYGWFGTLVRGKQYSGEGFGFAANAADVVKTEYINSYKLANIDTITSEQMIEIRSDDDELFMPDKRPIEYYFAAEKSFYGAINEKIIETFATLKDFNNLIGESANRYRPEYKELKNYRQLFFNRVQNDLDFERFIEYYKWVDSSISYIISQLIPASADFSPELSNIVESHILERNKYQHRLPVIKPMTVYQDNTYASPDSFPLSRKGQISRNLQNANLISSSHFLTASLNPLSYTASIENIVDLTYRNIRTSSYIPGRNDLNIIGVSRTKSKNRKAGNYLENHSNVMIPNKDGNNDFLLDMFHSVTPVADSFYVSGVVDYKLPTRPSQESTITCRFAAPGGPEVSSLGYLDYESTQYSVYNNLNYRNLVVRKALNELRGTASLDPTLFLNASDAASYNKNYRNPRREWVSASFPSVGNVIQTSYDNAWITYPIPASDLQYQWITASYSSSAFLTRQTGANDITFEPQSYYWWDVDPSSDTYLLSVDTASNTLNAAPTTALASNNYLSFIGRYGFSAWKEIRGADSAVARAHKKNNVLSIVDPLKEFNITYSTGKKGTLKGSVPISFTNYIEPTITKKYRPLKHTLVLNNKTEDRWVIKTPYSVLMAGFANREIDVPLKVYKRKKIDGYERIKSLYLNHPDPANASVKRWESIEYEEGIWPKEKFEGVNSHRDKPNYDSTATELKNNLCQYRTIWKDTALNRKRAVTSSFPFTNANNSVGIKNPFCENVFPLSDYSSTNVEPTTSSLELVLRDTAFQPQISGGMTQCPGLHAPTIDDFIRLYYDSTNYVEFTASGCPAGTHFTSGYNIFHTGSEPYVGLRYLSNKINQHPTASQYFVVSSVVSASNSQHTFIISSRIPGTQANLMSVSGSAIFSNGGAGGAEVTTRTYLSLGSASNYNRDGELNSSFLAIKGYSSSFDSGYREAGLFGGIPAFQFLTGSGEYPDDTPDLSSSLYCSPFSSYYYPTASQTFVHRPRPAMETNGTEVAPYNGHPYRVAQSSSRNPFFNSYGEYVESLKILTDDYSIVPEFNFSDHAPYYFDQKGGNLRSVNYKMLDIPGAKGTTSSANTEISSYNAAFHKDYAYTEFIQGCFDCVQQDHAQVGEIGYVTLTCKGIKKFLPKQGFYPVQRAVQLGTLFSQSIGPHLSGLGDIQATFTSSIDGEVTSSFSSQNTTLQSALQPLFSPGILYNTIKSGIAVDWPVVYSGSLEIEGNYDQQPSSSNVIISNASKRVPFEALADLDKFPRGENVLYLYPSWQTASSTCSRYPYFNWNGNKSSVLYEKAMNNFLAEIPNFFLENKNFSEFVSWQESDFKSFESGKTYYMDVSLRQTSNHFMWKDYFDGTVVNSLASTYGYNGRAFGPQWKDTGGDLYASWISSNGASAPVTPPYFYGEDLARFAFTPFSGSGKYSLDDIMGASTVEYLNPTLLATMTTARPSWINRMSLTSSVNLFQKITKPRTTIITDLAGAKTLTQNQVVDTNLESMIVGGIDASVQYAPALDTSYDAWRIVPKFECPTLNFINQPSEQYMSRGMWGGLGELPSGSDGIFLKVQESFSGSVVDANATGSLLDQIGFSTKEKRIGQIADNMVLEEAIIAIPFLERKNKNKREATLTTIAKHNFFKIDNNVFQKQIGDGKSVTTLTKMYKKMQKYVLPPNYNFIKYKDIDPFVMYIFEFKAGEKQKFTQQDLAYMWQGVMPDASLNDKEEFGEVTISHQTGPEEFFHGKEIPSDIRWLVFKVKKKARKSYSDVINLTSEHDQDYGYNWPYDYCSLVEMAKLEVNFMIKPKKDVPKEDKPKAGNVAEVFEL